MTRMGVPIGVAAVCSGVKVPTIRYDEEIGLLQAPRAQRTTGGITMRPTSANSSLSAMHANLCSKLTPSAPCSPFRITRISRADARYDCSCEAR
jgi:hypothetical protein